MSYKLELTGVTKIFGDLVANDNITIKIESGSIHSIVGENGAGKSTLMNVVYGLLKPDGGEIKFNGEKVEFDNPLQSIAVGLGMIHQHFMLIPTMTVLDNIILGYEIGNIKLNRTKAKEDLLPLMKNFGLEEKDFNTKVGTLPVGIQQKVEIIKALYRKADLIVFDEPTAVLTPQENVEFFELVKKLKEEGKTIIFISHKLNEIMELSDNISIMRAGKLVDTVRKEDVTEKELSRLMIGRDVVSQSVNYEENDNEAVVKVSDLVTEKAIGSMDLKNLSFEVKKGEIYGIAGVAGNGQTEMVNALVGMITPLQGKVEILGEDVTRVPSHKRKYKLAYIPEDRHSEGLILSSSIKRNLLLGKLHLSKFLKKKIFLNSASIIDNAEVAVKDYSIKTSGSIEDNLSSLSGGNQQKVVIARELNDDPDIILAVNPTRGVDVGSIEYIHNCLKAQKDMGKTILLVSNELTEILALSDRIGVIHAGKIVKVLKNKNLTKEKVGFYMLGGGDEGGRK